MADPNYNLKAGDSDKLGKTVERVLAKQVDKYVIYVTTDHELCCDAEEEALQENVNHHLIETAEFFAHSRALRRLYVTQIAHALKVAFDGDSDAAAKLLDGISEDMKRHLNRQAVQMYWLGAFAVTLVPLIAFWIYRAKLTPGEVVPQLWYSIVFSALGAFTSVYVGSAQLKLNVQDARWISTVNGGLRIVVAMISGVVVYFLVQADILLAFLKRSDSPYGLIIASYVAGFSEQLIPNAIVKIESSEGRQARRGATNRPSR